MSKPRSRLVNYSAREMRTVRGFTTALHFGRQAKHMPGQPSHDRTKSTITVSLPELQELVERKAGTGLWRGANKEIVGFGRVIGIYRDPKTREAFETSRGTIHYSKAGAHVVPTAPRPVTRRKRRS